MAAEVVMPKLGLTMTAGTIVKWLKQEGEKVKKGDALLEITTEELVNTVESPAEGVLLKILAAEGAVLPIGAVLGYIGAPGEELPGVCGTGPEADAKDAYPAAAAAVLERKSNAGGQARIKITPAAAKKAHELKLDYAQIIGTGPGGRITTEDVERYYQASCSREAAAENLDRGKQSSYETLPYAGMRKVIGDNMSRSWSTAAKVTEHVSVDVTRLLDLRQMLNENLPAGETKITLTDMLVKMVAAALEAKPSLNVSLECNNIKVLKDINIGVAVALENGLIVPVVKKANKKSIFQISREVKELALKGREGRLSPDEISEGTFTITNLGAYGSVDYFTPIINQPEAAILGIGRIVEKPVVIDKQIVIRPMMGLSLSFDHRVIDGAPAAEYLAELIRLINNPFRTIMSSFN